MNDLKREVSATLQSFLVKIDLEMINFYDPDRKEINKMVNRIKKETELAMSNSAAHMLFRAVVATNKIDGEIAEVGVFKGGSAKVISEAKGERHLHLFDTFKGAPKPDAYDDLMTSQEGQFGSDLNTVKEYLAEYPNVSFYEGFFPDTSGPVKETRFSLVHLDTNLHRSTHDCLEFFYPRMNRGGVIISHDYSYMTGVKKAFDDFFMDKPEIILGLPSYQCIVIKL